MSSASVRRSSQTEADEYRDYVIENWQHKFVATTATDSNTFSNSEVLDGQIARDEEAELVWAEIEVHLGLNDSNFTAGNGSVCTIQVGFEDDDVITSYGILTDENADDIRTINEDSNGLGNPDTVLESDVLFTDIMRIFAGSTDVDRQKRTRDFKGTLGEGPTVYHNDELSVQARFNDKNLTGAHELVVFGTFIWDVKDRD